MFGLGLFEWLVILVVVLLVFGAGKLPQIGDALGRSIKNFKRAASGDAEIEVNKKKEVEGRAGAKRVAAGAVDEVEDAEVVPATKTPERK